MQIDAPSKEGFLERVYRRSHSQKSVLLNQTVIRIFEGFCRDKLHNEPDQVIAAFKTNDLDVYTVLDAFVKYLDDRSSPSSINTYFALLKNYLRYYDVEIYNEKCRSKVVLPKIKESRDGEMDSSIVQRILDVFPQKWRVLFLISLSSLARPGELLRLRVRDIDFESNPTRVHIPAFISKNDVERTTYITQEAARVLKDYLGNKIKQLDTPIFGEYKNEIIAGISAGTVFRDYMQKLPDLNNKISGTERKKIMKIKKKDGTIEYREVRISRYKLHIYSFKKYGYSIIANRAGEEYARLLKGDKGVASMYYRMTQDQRDAKYRELEPFLTIQNADKLQMQYIQTTEQQQKRIQELENKLHNTLSNEHYNILLKTVIEIETDRLKRGELSESSKAHIELLRREYKQQFGKEIEEK